MGCLYPFLTKNIIWKVKVNFLKYLQIWDCITKGQFIQGKNPVMEFLESPCIARRAAMFYKMFNRLQEEIFKNLRIIWQKDLGCDFSDEEWVKILSNTGKYVREARGKFIQFKLIHRFYFTPKRHRMGLLTNNLCWKCFASPSLCLSLRTWWQNLLNIKVNRIHVHFNCNV